MAWPIFPARDWSAGWRACWRLMTLTDVTVFHLQTLIDSSSAIVVSGWRMRTCANVDVIGITANQQLVHLKHAISTSAYLAAMYRSTIQLLASSVTALFSSKRSFSHYNLCFTALVQLVISAVGATTGGRGRGVRTSPKFGWTPKLFT